MRQVFRCAAPLLLAAVAFGLIRPAATWSSAPQPAPFVIVPNDDAPPLPRVVPPPGRLVLEPEGTPVGRVSGQAAPAAKVDLLAAPALPAAWSAPPAKPEAAVAVPRGGAPTRPPAAAYPASMTPAPLVAHAPSPAGIPARLRAAPPTSASAPVVASGRPVAQPTPAKRSWPTAFQTRDESQGYETTGLVYFETPVEQAKPAVAVRQAVATARVEPSAAAAKPAVMATPAPAADPALSGDLRQRVRTACGREATAVEVVTRPDKTVLVSVRVRDAVSEALVTERILQLPEMARPTVYLQMEVQP